ncbi:MAG: SDR family NAD(P)-dependent oxidoreductase [Cellvibrionales bacterium]|nr:SDR family NAD(P)-dependent oxidoreductase [Cellvibrionales bacterium]
MSKIVLITGASSGFGESCAHLYAKQGFKLILVSRRLDKLQQLAQALLLENGSAYPASNVLCWAVDVTDAEAIDQFVNELPESFGAVDILINNAGLALGTAPAHKANLSDWETMVDTNIKGLIRMTHKLLPGMVARNRGHIVNIGSIAGNWPYPGGNTYCATKAFVHQFSLALRADLLGKAIRVSHIDPGMAETNFSRIRMKGDNDAADAFYHDVKPLSADDVADIIVWTTSVPEHININSLEVMPVCQAWSPFAIDRTMENKQIIND